MFNAEHEPALIPTFQVKLSNFQSGEEIEMTGNQSFVQLKFSTAPCSATSFYEINKAFKSAGPEHQTALFITDRASVLDITVNFAICQHQQNSNKQMNLADPGSHFLATAQAL